MAQQFMQGRVRVNPLVILLLDRFTIGLPCSVTSLSEIDCTFAQHYKDGVQCHPLRAQEVLEETYWQFQQALEQHLQQRPNTQKCKFKDGKCPRRTYRVCGSDGKTGCYVIVGSSYGHPYVHFQFNPSKISPAGIEEFLRLLDEVFVHGYQSLFTHGVLSHAELAADAGARAYKDTVLLYIGNKQLWTNKGSIYVGYNGGPKQGRLYDGSKLDAKAMKKNGKCKPVPYRVRWETVITRRDLTLANFVEDKSECHLANYRLLPLSHLQDMMVACGLDPQLAPTIRLEGQRKVLNPQQCAELEAKLDASAFTWGKPTYLWPFFKELLHGLRPPESTEDTQPLVKCSPWNPGPLYEIGPVSGISSVEPLPEEEYDV